MRGMVLSLALGAESVGRIEQSGEFVSAGMFDGQVEEWFVGHL